jgi:hypothetical protein
MEVRHSLQGDEDVNALCLHDLLERGAEAPEDRAIGRSFVGGHLREVQEMALGDEEQLPETGRRDRGVVRVPVLVLVHIAAHVSLLGAAAATARAKLAVHPVTSADPVRV